MIDKSNSKVWMSRGVQPYNFVFSSSASAKAYSVLSADPLSKLGEQGLQTVTPSTGPCLRYWVTSLNNPRSPVALIHHVRTRAIPRSLSKWVLGLHAVPRATLVGLLLPESDEKTASCACACMPLDNDAMARLRLSTFPHPAKQGDARVRRLRGC